MTHTNIQRVLKVTWRDSAMFITQCSPDDNFNYTTIISIGFVVMEAKDRIVLVGDLVEGEYRRAIVIPRENIISIDETL